MLQIHFKIFFKIFETLLKNTKKRHLAAFSSETLYFSFKPDSL